VPTTEDEDKFNSQLRIIKGDSIALSNPETVATENHRGNLSSTLQYSGGRGDTDLCRFLKEHIKVCLGRPTQNIDGSFSAL